jgi:hypothetical protein
MGSLTDALEGPAADEPPHSICFPDLVGCGEGRQTSSTPMISIALASTRQAEQRHQGMGCRHGLGGRGMGSLTEALGGHAGNFTVKLLHRQCVDLGRGFPQELALFSFITKLLLRQNMPVHRHHTYGIRVTGVFLRSRPADFWDGTGPDDLPCIILGDVVHLLHDDLDCRGREPTSPLGPLFQGPMSRVCN